MITFFLDWLNTGIYYFDNDINVTNNWGIQQLLKINFCSRYALQVLVPADKVCNRCRGYSGLSTPIGQPISSKALFSFAQILTQPNT
ncbi:MAG: hypothetical protein ABJA37_06160 [Ferruginibacter sp.]